MIEVGDMRDFAQKFGQWLSYLNPDLDAEKLRAVVKKFAQTAPIGVTDINQFCDDAAIGYAQEAEKKD